MSQTLGLIRNSIIEKHSDFSALSSAIDELFKVNVEDIKVSDGNGLLFLLRLHGSECAAVTSVQTVMGDWGISPSAVIHICNRLDGLETDMLCGYLSTLRECIQRSSDPLDVLILCRLICGASSGNKRLRKTLLSLRVEEIHDIFGEGYEKTFVSHMRNMGLTISDLYYSLRATNFTQFYLEAIFENETAKLLYIMNDTDRAMYIRAKIELHRERIIFVWEDLIKDEAFSIIVSNVIMNFLSTGTLGELDEDFYSTLLIFWCRKQDLEDSFSSTERNKHDIMDFYLTHESPSITVSERMIMCIPSNNPGSLSTTIYTCLKAFKGITSKSNYGTYVNDFMLRARTGK